MFKKNKYSLIIIYWVLKNCDYLIYLRFTLILNSYSTIIVGICFKLVVIGRH